VCEARGVGVIKGPLVAAYPSARVDHAVFEEVVGRIVEDVQKHGSTIKATVLSMLMRLAPDPFA
jgi:(2Fe-2S) ferredoxin